MEKAQCAVEAVLHPAAQQAFFHSPQRTLADPLPALEKPVVGESYKDNGKSSRQDRGCLTAIALYRSCTPFHLPVSIPRAPHCASIWTF